MQFFDSHIHLDHERFSEILTQELALARSVHITNWIVPSIDTNSLFKVKELCNLYSGCLPAFGLHPYFIDTHTEEDLQTLEFELQNAIAVGECGLDLFIETPQIEKQLYFFKRHLELARSMHLPIIIHARKSVDLVLKELRLHKGLTGVIHSFSGSMQQAEQLIDLGFKLGFGGTITFPRAQKVRQIATTIPDEALLIETDAPDQPGIYAQNSYHRPRDLIYIAQELAILRNQSVEEIATITTNNAKNLFQIQGVTL